MRKAHAWVAGAVAAVPLLAATVVPLLGGSASARPAPIVATPDPRQSDWPNQDRLSQAAEAAMHLGEHHPTVYAGVELDIPADVLIVYRVQGDAAAFDQAVRDGVRTVAAPSQVILRDAPYSQAQLYGWVATLRDDVGHWKSRGVDGYSVVAGPGEDCVRVGLRNLDRDGDTFREHYDFPLCLGPAMEITW